MARRAWNTRTLLRLCLLAILVAAIAAVFAADLHSRIDAEELRRSLRERGALGAACFVVAFALLQPIGVAVHIFLITASLVWSAPVATGLSWLGAMGAGIVAFSFSRFVAYEWVQPRVPARLRRYDQTLETRGFRTILILRLIFYTTPVVQALFGVSRVRFRVFLAASAIGVVPATAFFVLLGGNISSWLDEHPVASWNWAYLGWAAGGAAAAFGLYVLARRRTRSTTPTGGAG